MQWRCHCTPCVPASHAGRLAGEPAGLTAGTTSLHFLAQSAADSSSLLRPGLLDAVSVVVAGGGSESRFGAVVAARCKALGAGVKRFDLDPFGDEPPAGEGRVLVWDGAGAFETRDGIVAVRAALDGAWLAIRPFARAATSGGGDGAKVLLLAPAPGDAHAEAARAGSRTWRGRRRSSGPASACVLWPCIPGRGPGLRTSPR